MELNLFEHNQKAYDAAVTLMEETGKAAVIHPTGTGKSFIAFRLVADHPDKKILWLSPGSYIYLTQLANLKKALEKQEADKQAENKIHAFIEHLEGQIEFLTYSKLMMNEQNIVNLHPDFIILDEFHRCGASEWGKSVRKLLDSSQTAKILGLSATNIRYLDNRRDMAEELFDGCIASQISIGEAVARNILPAPLYVISMYSYREEIECLGKRVDAEKNPVLRTEQEKILKQLRRSLEQADGLEVIFHRHMKRKHGKYIVFCADKEHMQEMTVQMKEWVRLVDMAPHIYNVYYDSPASEQEYKAFMEDESRHLKLLFCIDMLNEGVHVSGVDGVILLRPTVSPILYLQQIGRGLNTGKNYQPVIFDIVNNFDSLYSVDALWNEAAESRRLLPCSEIAKVKYYDTFRIIDELRDARKLFRQLADSLNISWNHYYSEAERYFKQNGNLNIPKRYVTEQGLNLGMWLSTQRRVYKGKVVGSLSEEQVKKLEQISMDWEDVAEQKFRKGYAALETYKSNYGDTDVASSYKAEDGYALGKWVSNMRSAYKNGKLDLERKAELDRLGMIWDVRAYRWERSYRTVAAYYEMHGNLDIPTDYIDADGRSLTAWVRNQKNALLGKMDAAPLTEVQIQKLEALGITGKNRYEERWQNWYTLAELYYQQHGDLKVCSSYCMNGKKLGKWINDVRSARKVPECSNRRLTEERIRQLDAIGMQWD